MHDLRFLDKSGNQGYVQKFTSDHSLTIHLNQMS